MALNLWMAEFSLRSNELISTGVVRSAAAFEQYAAAVRAFIPRVVDGAEQSFNYAVKTGRQLCGPCSDRNCACAYVSTALAA